MTSSTPGGGALLSQHAAARVEEVEIAYLRARVGALAALPGNPYGAHILGTGAFLVEKLANPLFNHVMGLTTPSDLPALASFYAEHGRPLRVDVTPSQSSLLPSLPLYGLAQTGFYAGLYAPAFTSTPALTVTSCDPTEFSQVYVTGFAFPTERRPAMAHSLTVLADHPQCHFFRVLIGTTTAGVGLLFVTDGTGYLATAATLPQHRGHGVQTALIQHRASVATSLGCDLIVGHTAVHSPSQRTMERCGLRLAYTKALWSSAPI